MGDGLSEYERTLLAYGQATRARDFDRAESLVAALARLPEASQALLASCRAEILKGRGQFDAAVRVLTHCIDVGRDSNQLCRFDRADSHLETGRLEAALFDYRVVADDRTPQVVEAYQASARFRLAWCLARLGRDEYWEVQAKIAPGYEEYVFDNLYVLADLREIWERRRAAMRG